MMQKRGSGGQRRGSGWQRVMSSESERVSDRDAQTYNISAARSVAEAVKATLGPTGLDKLLVDSSGGLVVTNDGERILRSMEIANPTARLIADVAEAQADAVGDGTTSGVVLAGELLGNAGDLLDRGVHPQSILEGFTAARRTVGTELPDLGTPVDAGDTELLRSVAETALTGSLSDGHRRYLATLVVEAVQRTATDRGLQLDFVDIETESGDAISESELFEGAIYDRKLLHREMPAELPNARVLFLKGEATLEPKIPGDERDFTFKLETPEDRQSLYDLEDDHRFANLDSITAADVNCVFCEKGIDSDSQQYLADAGILAVRRIEPTDLEFFQRVLGGTVLTHLDDVDESDVGTGTIRRDPDGERMYITGDDGDAVTLFVRGPTEMIAEELERSLTDALRAVEQALVDGAVVPGAGAAEVALARRIRSTATATNGRAQLAVEAVADAIEALPKTIVANAGGDGIDVLVALRAAHSDGESRTGWDARRDEPVDAVEAGIVEPLSVKRQAIDSAIEAASLVLRIDDIVAATDLEKIPDEN